MVAASKRPVRYSNAQWRVPPESATADQEENVGVYRMQVLGRDRAVIRWLAHRGGARHHQQWKVLGRDMPVAIVIGADPATILAAVLPLPETMSELRFAGILRYTKVTYSLIDIKDIPTPGDERELAWLLSFYWHLDKAYDTLAEAVDHCTEGMRPPPHLLRELSRTCATADADGLRLSEGQRRALGELGVS